MTKLDAKPLPNRVLLASVTADSTRTRIRQRIKRLLEDRGKTQREFARWLGHGDQWASSLFAGRMALSLDDIDRVAAFFNVPPGEIVRVSEEPWELSPTEMRVVRALRMLPPPVRDGYAMLADWTIGALPDEYDLLIEIRNADEETIAALKHFLQLKRVEQAHARRGVDRAETPAPTSPPQTRSRRTRVGTRR